MFKCSYDENVMYALKALNLPKAVLYLGAGQGVSLRWEDNLQPAADYLAARYNAAGSSSLAQGFAVNTGGWNSQ